MACKLMSYTAALCLKNNSNRMFGHIIKPILQTINGSFNFRYVFLVDVCEYSNL